VKVARFAFALLCVGAALNALTTFALSEPTFDGARWNVSTGNLSVSFIQASPIGAFPKPDFFEPPPSVESQKRWKALGLVANEDYIAWGAVERKPGEWLWQQHDAVEVNLHAAGLKYVVYNWAHFPPVWLRERKDARTLMRCTEHGLEANYLSIFDPRTLEWYDHFYKNIATHFGARIDDIYACILGPYGEGNYPLMVPDWVNMGHCHEGYWCGDEFAWKAFRAAMRAKYKSIAFLNDAWGTSNDGFEAVAFPRELAIEKYKPSPEQLRTPQEKRRWLDFVTWYHQALVDFAEQSLKTVLKYFPADHVRMKPGGSSGGINPLTYGTHCPAYAKMAKQYGIVLQPADCQGAVFADKWMGTAYQFYGVKECTEPAGGLDAKAFARRMFSDAASGAAQMFTYEFEQHVAEMQRAIPLFTGKAGDTEIAVYCPTTYYRLGGDLKKTIESCQRLRDLCDFDVLDEVVLADGALTRARYRTLLVFQGDIIEQPILEVFDQFYRAGGKIIAAGDVRFRNVVDAPWPRATEIARMPRAEEHEGWLQQLAADLAPLAGCDGKRDGIWSCRRGNERFFFNSTTARAARS
jgi:hypothetical protein